MRIIERRVDGIGEALYEGHFTRMRCTLGYIEYMVHSEHGFVAAYDSRSGVDLGVYPSILYGKMYIV